MGASKSGLTIPEDTWRGKAAQCMSKETWVDCYTLADQMIEAEFFKPENASKRPEDSASSILADMNRHENVERLKIIDEDAVLPGERIEYVYRLREGTRIV